MLEFKRKLIEGKFPSEVLMPKRESRDKAVLRRFSVSRASEHLSKRDTVVETRNSIK